MTGVIPKNINVTSRYLMGWEINGNQSSNLTTFLWDSELQLWKSLTGKSQYHPMELESTGMFIVEKVSDDFFFHDKTFFNGMKDVGIDIGNW